MVNKNSTLKERIMNPTMLEKEQRLGYLLLFPAILIVGGMYLYPALLTIAFSLSEVNAATFSIDEFVGVHHYISYLTQPGFWTITGRTIYFALMIIVLSVIISFGVGLLLNKVFVGRSFLRVIVLLPWAVPPVVAGVLWGQMFHAETGMLNALLRQLGIISENIIWLSDSTVALHVIIIAEVWRAIPFITLFILAGLQNVNPSLYEATSIDGANTWQKFRFVTLPLIYPVLVPIVLLQFSFAIKAFDTIYVLTGGSRGTSTLNYLVYQEAFEYLEFGASAAIAYLLFILTIVFVLLLVFLQRRLVKGGSI